MKKYTVAFSPDTPDWNTVKGIKIDKPVSGEQPDYNIEFKLAWNESKLFVHASSEEPYIRAMYSGVAAPVWQDSYIGISFKPVKDDARYFSLLANSNGALNCTLGTSADNKAQLLLIDEMESFQIKTSRSESSWQISFEFPLYLVKSAFPGFSFISESTIEMNCFKGGERAYFPHFLSWEPCPDPKKAAPHNCNFFGTMILEKPFPSI